MRAAPAKTTRADSTRKGERAPEVGLADTQGARSVNRRRTFQGRAGVWASSGPVHEDSPEFRARELLRRVADGEAIDAESVHGLAAAVLARREVALALQVSPAASM